MLAIWLKSIPLFVHFIVLAYLNCHLYILFVMGCTLVGLLVPSSDFYYFITGSWLLLIITIFTTYPIASNGNAPRQKEQATYHQVGRLVEMGDCFRHNTYVYISYVSEEWGCYACTYFCAQGYLCITTTIAGEWLNNLIFCDYTKCIIAIG